MSLVHSSDTGYMATYPYYITTSQELNLGLRFLTGGLLAKFSLQTIPFCHLDPHVQGIRLRDLELKTGGGGLVFRLDIILVKGLSKYTLNTYFSGMKIDPKYVFLHAFFLICVSCPFQINQYDQTHTFFSNFARFAPLNDVRAYIAWC